MKVEYCNSVSCIFNCLSGMRNKGFIIWVNKYGTSFVLKKTEQEWIKRIRYGRELQT